MSVPQIHCAHAGHLSNNTRVGDDDSAAGSTGLRADGLDLLDDSLGSLISDLAEDAVLAVEPGAGDGGDEELRAVGVGTSVSHGEEEGLLVAELEVLILELAAVDRDTTGTVAASEVTTLEHELRDDTVERRLLVTVTSGGLSKSTEVLAGDGGNLIEELHDDATNGLVVDADIEENITSGLEAGDRLVVEGHLQERRFRSVQ